MKVCILGINGYIGAGIGKYLNQSPHTVIGTSRNQIDFDRADAFKMLESFLDYEKPDFIVNAIGSIDSKTDNPLKIFNAVFLPNYFIFQYYKSKRIEKNTYIWTLGSNSAGKPRVHYPVYAALKGAEFSLFQTIKEAFENSKIKWFYTVFPRLSGGLANNSLETMSDSDYNLISIEIKNIINNFERISTS